MSNLLSLVQMDGCVPTQQPTTHSRREHAYVPRDFTFTLITNRMFTVGQAIGNFRHIHLFLLYDRCRRRLIVILLDIRAAISCVSRQFWLIDTERRWGIVRVR